MDRNDSVVINGIEHMPFMKPERPVGIGESEYWCLHCGDDWPCRAVEVATLEGRVSSLESAISEYLHIKNSRTQRTLMALAIAEDGLRAVPWGQEMPNG